MRLTDKQKMFVDEYMVDLNATQAAIRAGYSEKTASRIAIELLNKTHVAERLQKRMRDREKRTEITQDRVLQELAHIAFDDIKHYLDFGTVADPETKLEYIRVRVKDSQGIDTRSISEVSLGRDGQFKFKLYCKDNALLQVGKHLGMFRDGLDINSNVAVQIIDNIPRQK